MRTCIFCERPANSKEDAWPLWRMRRLGAIEAGTVEAQRGKQTLTTWHAGGLRVGFVCINCNSGWMSQLENRAKPIIGSLFSEKSVVLDRSDQFALAAWASKNAMVYEALRSEASWFFTNPERRALRESLRLPLWTSVWIAKCVEHTGVYCKASDLVGVAEVSKDQVKTYVTTMGFGPLAIQVVSSKLPSFIPP